MRWIIRVVLGLVALGLVAIVTLLVLPADRIASLVETRFEQATGRRLSVDGDVRPTLWPSLGVSIGKVEIANAAWSDAGPMLRAERLSIAVDPLSLLAGDIRISAVHAEAPQILLEIRADGSGNWEMSPKPKSATTGEAGGLPPLSIDKATVRRGALRFVDHRSGADHRLSALEASLAIPSMSARSTFDIAAVLNGQTATARGSIEGLGAFLRRGAVPVGVDLGVGRAKAAFTGRAGLVPLAAAGRLSADLGNLAPVLAALGAAPVTLPRGLGRDKVAVVGDVTFTDGLLNLRDATLTLDTNTLAGAADLALGGARPAINARLTTGALDLSGLSGEQTGAAGVSATGWSRAPIDISGLQALDAKVALSATSVRIGKTALGRTDLYTTLESGRAVTEIREVQAYGGRFDGSFVLNSRGGLSTRLILDGSALAISRLLSELLEFDRLVASGNLSLNLLGVGNDLDAIVNSLSGDGQFTTGAGELLGLDLVGMLRTLDPKFMGKGSKTIFDKVSASFTVANGVLRNDDLSLLAPLIAASGSGTVGLGARDLDYRLVPRLLGESGIRVPILITGTWDAPRFKLDLQDLARGTLDAEGRKLEEKAKAAALARLEEKLGVPLETSRDVEDALKTKIEEEAARGLLKLLGSN